MPLDRGERQRLDLKAAPPFRFRQHELIGQHCARPLPFGIAAKLDEQLGQRQERLLIVGTVVQRVAEFDLAAPGKRPGSVVTPSEQQGLDYDRPG